jgi:hypothetical protein
MVTVLTERTEMKKAKENISDRGRGRRKRGAGDDAHKKPIWAYVTDVEWDIIDQASGIDGRSRSNFVSDAALARAEEMLRIYRRGAGENPRLPKR